MVYSTEPQSGEGSPLAADFSEIRQYKRKYEMP
jgi:hypothetical protein